MTQPFQLVLLWASGVQVAWLQTPAVQTPAVHVPAVQVPGGVHTPAVQVPRPQMPPLFWHWVFVVYCDLVQCLVPVQLVWFVTPGFEQVPAFVQLFWLV